MRFTTAAPALAIFFYAIFVIVMLFMAVFASVAHAAAGQRVLGWEIVIFFDRPTPDDRTFRTISGRYVRKTDCDEAARNTQVVIRGGTLRCRAVMDWTVR